MHTGEEFFNWSWPQYALIAGVMGSYLILSFANRLPSMNSFKEFADTINTAGGNIILLTLLTVWSIKIAMQFFYHLLGMTPEQFDKTSSIVTAGITYVQGGLSGMFIGALIKTLTGGKANGHPVPDEPADVFARAAAPSPLAGAAPTFPAAVPGPESPSKP